MEYIINVNESNKEEYNNIELGWYFIDETWNFQGPYQSHEECKKALIDYINNLL